MKNVYCVEAARVALSTRGTGSRGQRASAAGDTLQLACALADSEYDVTGHKIFSEQHERKRRSRSSPVRVASLQYADGAGADSTMWRAYYNARPPVSPLQLRALPLLSTTAKFSDVSTATPSFPLPQKKKVSQNNRRVRSILRELIADLPTKLYPPAATEATRPAVPSELRKSAEPSKLSKPAQPARTSVLSEMPALLPASLSSSDSSRVLETDQLDESPSMLVPTAAAQPSAPVPSCRPSSAPPTPVRCHVAVQALELSRKHTALKRDLERRVRARNCSRSRARAEGARRTRSPAAVSPELVAGAEWVGGVRALRDAHVCHVLRQLRHLRHLNAAVDRAAAAAAHAATTAI